MDETDRSTAASIAEPPAGSAAGTRSTTLTFLFTDIEGSTRRWEQSPDAMRSALARHDEIVEDAITQAGGRVVKATGDGRMAVFSSIGDGLAACLAVQRGIGNAAWHETTPLRVRMALHSGEAEQRAGDYFGTAVNRTARIMAAGHGGQVLLSAVAAGLAQDQLPPGVTLRDLGEHRLKDLERPEHIFQLVAPDLDEAFPPLVTLSARPNNLPTQTSAFVGREVEVTEIGRLLGDPDVRLLTLTGPGGTGKTRLALRAAADQVEQFDDGVFLVDLSSATDAPTVLALIARDIGLIEGREVDVADEVRRHLATRRLLLVLDNFEQVSVAAPTVAELLREAPGLKVLVTSRQPLHVRGENQFPVPPLSLPRAGEQRATAAQLGQFEALQLFVERARAVRPDFRLTDDNAAAVAEICRRLDGLPLAIELATARINLFSPEALRDRLDSRLKLLRSGPRDLPARQQTLTATIDWSYRLLEPDEQRLLQLLSVFSGVALEALEAVASGLDTLGDVDVVDGLSSLVDKSLAREAEAMAGEREPRFSMLETIREYALARLEEDPVVAAAVRDAHAAHFAAFATRQWELATGQERDAALGRIGLDLDNLRAAWRHFVGRGDLAGVGQLFDSLWLLYDGQGWYQASMTLLTDMLGLLEAAPPSRERRQKAVTLRVGLARTLLSLKGYTQEAETAYQEALELFEADPELSGVFPVLRALASYYTYRAEFDKTEQVGRKILQVANAQGDPSMQVDAHLVVATGISFRGRLREGLEHLETAIGAFETLAYRPRRFRLGSDPRVPCLTTSAFVLWLLGRPDQARARAARAVELASELEHPFTLGYGLFHTGFLYIWTREPELAKQRAETLLRRVDEHEIPIWRALANVLLGAALGGFGRADEGLAQIDEGLRLYEGLTTPPVFWPLLKFLRAGAALGSATPASGMSDVDEALDVVGTQDVLAGEFLILKGDLLTAVDRHQEFESRRLYTQAFEASVRLEAVMPQLRAALRLCGSAGRPEDVERLRAVYETFTEGFSTPDLVDTASLLRRSGALP